MPMHVADPRQMPANVFLYTLHPTRLEMLSQGPTDAERAVAAEHWAYSQRLLAESTIVFAGRTMSMDADTFALMVIRAESADAARTIMNEDPAVKGGVFRGRLFPFQPMLMGDWPPESATVPIATA